MDDPGVQLGDQKKRAEAEGEEMNLQKILDMGGSIEISKNERGAIRQKDRAGLPIRITVELPNGYRSALNGYEHIGFIFQSDYSFIDSLQNVDTIIGENVLPPAAGT